MATLGIAYFLDHVFQWLLRPITLSLADHGHKPEIVFINLTEPFWIQFKLALVGGVILSSPFIFWELWKFVAPGLYKGEKKMALVMAGATGFCFAFGAIFGYAMLSRNAAFYLMGMTDEINNWSKVVEEAASTSVTPAEAPDGTPEVTVPDSEASGGKPAAPKAAAEPAGITIKPMMTMEKIVGFQITLLIGCGLGFELPVVLAILGFLGLVDHKSLWKFNRYAVILCAVAGGILTPGPDVISQLLLAGPLFALYNLSILIVFVINRGQKKKIEALEDQYEQA